MDYNDLSKETLVSIIKDLCDGHSRTEFIKIPVEVQVIKYEPFEANESKRNIIARYLNNKVALRDNYSLAIKQAEELMELLK